MKTSSTFMKAGGEFLACPQTFANYCLIFVRQILDSTGWHTKSAVIICRFLRNFAPFLEFAPFFSFCSIFRYYKQVSFLTPDGESCPPTFEYTRRSHLTMDSARVDPENYCDAKPTKVCNYCITGPSTSKDYFYDCEFKSQKTLNYPKGKCSKFNIRTNGFC